MKRMMLILLISSPCLAYRGYMPEYRQVQVDDVLDKQLREENDRLRLQNERLARINTRTNVVYVRNRGDNFCWLTNSDKNMIKYAIFGAVLCYLILK